MSEHIRTPSAFGRRRDRRSILRTLPLSPIGDIASGGLTKSTQTAETLTWETATDWDNKASQNGTVHESTQNTDLTDDTVVSIGHSTEDIPNSSNALLWYLLQEDSGSTVNDFSGNGNDGSLNGGSLNQGNLFGRTGYSNTEGDYITTGANDPTDQFTAASWFSTTDTTNSPVGASWSSGDPTGFFHGINVRNQAYGGSNGRVSLAWRGSNGDSFKWSTSNSYNDGNPHLAVWTFDVNRSTEPARCWVDGSKESLTKNVDQGSLDPSNGNTILLGRNVFDGQGFSGDIYRYFFYNATISDADALALSQVGDDNFGSTLTTATKTFSTSSTPNISSLDYTLNAQDITLDVIGSPGTASEEVVSQVLDGASSYSLTWSNSHTDFRVRPKFSTTDKTTTPTVNSVTLES